MRCRFSALTTPHNTTRPICVILGLRKENPTKGGVRRAVLQGAEHILRLGYAIPTAICYRINVRYGAKPNGYICENHKHKKRFSLAIAPPTKTAINIAMLYIVLSI